VDFVAVAPDAANALAERGVRLVGIDYLSIASYE
jgi:kynurenine formamidase